MIEIRKEDMGFCSVKWRLFVSSCIQFLKKWCCGVVLLDGINQGGYATSGHNVNSLYIDLFVIQEH